MKKLITLLVVTLLFLVMKPNQTFASHLAGAEITYAPTGIPLQFLVKVAVYRDCLGIPVDPSYPVCYQSALLGLNGTFTVNQVSVDSVGSSPCVTAQATCAGSLGDIEIYRFEGIIDLPAQTTDWYFFWSSSARNSAITTLQFPGSLTTHALLNNLDAPTNSSPVFSNPAYTRFCVGNFFNYVQQASDPNGDSLVFSLVNAQEGNPCPTPFTDVTYAPIISVDPLAVNGALYSGIYPFSSITPIIIDPQTGTMQFTPLAQQVAVIALKVQDFRNGVQVGEVVRDIQIKITAQCRLIQPGFAPGTIGGSTVGGVSGGFVPVNCNDRTIILPLDTLYPIQCASAIPSDFRTLAPYGTPNPVIAVTPLTCANGYTDSLVITFLNPLSAGVTRLWSKKGFDGNTFLGECGFELIDSQDTVYLYVDSTVIAKLTPQIDSIGCIFNAITLNLSDSIYCSSIAADGSDFLITDATETVFPVASAYGYCSLNGLKTNAVLINMASNTSGTGPFYVTVGGAFTDGNTLSDNCGREITTGDTLAVLYVNNKINVSLGPDQTLCIGTTPITISASIPGLQYTWYDGSTVIPGQTSQQLPVTTSSVYTVQVNNGPTCSGRDTIVMNLFPAPTDNLGADIIQCINDPAPTFDAGNTGSQFQWYFNGLPLTNDTLSTFTPNSTTSGTYSVRVVTGGVCQASFDIMLNTFNTIPVNVLSNETICVGATATQLDAGPAAATNATQWSLNGTAIAGATNQFYTPTTGGSYTVSVGTGSCAATSSMTLSTVAKPNVTLSNVTLCNYDPIPQLSVSSVSGASYQWNQNGTAISGATSNQYTPTVADNYSVDVTVPPGCTGSANMTLAINNAVVFSIADTIICNGGSASLTVAATADSYLWSNGETTQTITTTTAGAYNVLVTKNGCISRDTASVAKNSYPVAPVLVCGPATPGGSTSYTFVYTWKGIPGAVSYEISEDGGTTWVAANGASGTAESHGTSSTANLIARALGSAPCINGEASQPTYCDIDFYNVVSPNGDGKNDYFKITNIEQYPNNNVQIFNRWGKEVFSKDNYSNANSNTRFEGKDLPEGTYYFIINLNQEGKDPKSGVITITR